MKKAYSLYLAGSVRLWKKEFKEKYSGFFNHKIKLFEPGTMNIPDDHRLIKKQVVERCCDEIRKSDALLVYMKSYKPSKHGGPIGTDSSWECGFAYGIKKPSIAIIDDFSQLSYFECQWMVPFNINAYLTTKKEVAEKIKKTVHFKNSDVIFCESVELIEQKISKYLDTLV
jgi:nucleoside 2-deoxyribosyltransferase